MGLNDTPFANRVHIGFFGRRNAGKSSLVNAVTGQDLAVVSEIKGTTTDPVYKAMELLPLGPVLIIDTPGIDDEGALGALRVRRAKQVLNKTDVAVLVLDASAKDSAAPDNLFPAERELLDLFRARGVPHITVWNKSDLVNEGGSLPPRSEPSGFSASPLSGGTPPATPPDAEIAVSAKTGLNITLLKERLAALAALTEPEPPLAADLAGPGDFALLVAPIDKAAPKGRLILPQQQVIRELLEAGVASVVVRETELRVTLERLGRSPALVITDSQVFAEAAAAVPEAIPLTSFSILFARRKGSLAASVRGVRLLDSLAAGDKVLIAEGCTHHRQCDDIGTVKLPRWIREYSGVEPEFHFCSGGEFPEDLSPFRLLIHCGGCMLNEREMRRRRRSAEDQHIPLTNYGIAIACIRGILRRSLAVFPNILSELDEN
jgi:[FeFe] hydrogenase H-cluster maturation GTPase HydF